MIWLLIGVAAWMVIGSGYAAYFYNAVKHMPADQVAELDVDMRQRGLGSHTDMCKLLLLLWPLCLAVDLWSWALERRGK